MPRKKTTEHKYRHPDLNTPMVAPRVPLTGTDEDFAKARAEINAERYRRMNLLIAEFGMGDMPFHAAMFPVAIVLAMRYVPGLQMVERRAGRGAPKKEGLFSDPRMLLMAVDLTRTGMGLDSDKKACDVLVTCQNPELEKPRNKTQRAKAARTLANLVAHARKEAAASRH